MLKLRQRLPLKLEVKCVLNKALERAFQGPLVRLISRDGWGVLILRDVSYCVYLWEASNDYATCYSTVPSKYKLNCKCMEAFVDSFQVA